VNGKLFRLKSFFTYWLDAVDEHSLHSPFLFDFYTRVIKQKVSADFDSLRAIRKKFRHDHRPIHVTDLGAGSAYLNTNRKISDIVRLTSTPDKFSSLYARIIRYHRFEHVIELGTSIGINTMYLAKSNKNVEVTTLEGSPEIAAIARKLFASYDVSNIKLLEGDIDNTLEPYLTTVKRIDFALVDANHRYNPTLRYLELLIEKIDAHSVIAVDDIHHSAEMERAWHTIQNDPRVYTTIDLYRCGLIFFNPSLTRQNVVLQF
jgi:predicted O-methyltransferase YrrM